MFTKRVSLVTLAGLIGGFFLIGSLALPVSASAQATKGGVKARTKAGAQATVVKWDSLTADQQAYLQQEFKMDALHAKEKWDASTSEQQQKVITKAKAGGQRAAAIWKSLPQ